MYRIDLFEKARKLLGTKSDKRFIYDALCYAEKRVSLLEVERQYNNLLHHDTMSDELEDYCLAVLNGKARPLQFVYNPKNK